jgi:ribosome maturation factor RimP
LGNELIKLETELENVYISFLENSPQMGRFCFNKVEMNKKEKIENKAKEILEEKGFFLIDFVWRGSEQRPVLELFMDNARGITTDDCYEVSRELEKFIDENELLRQYRLDVSSPGVDKPLVFAEQFPKHVGRNFEIEYTDDETEKHTEAKLIEAKGDNFVFETTGKGKEKIEINFNNIKKAKVLISF